MAYTKKNTSTSSTIGIRLDHQGRYTVILLHRNPTASSHVVHQNLTARDAISHLHQMIADARRLNKHMPLKIILLDSPNHSTNVDPLKTTFSEVLSYVGNPYRLTILTNREKKEAATYSAANIAHLTILPIEVGAVCDEDYNSYLLNAVKAANKTAFDKNPSLFDTIHTLLDDLAAKKIDLKNRGHEEAFNSARWLERELRRVLFEFKLGDQSEPSYQSFKNQWDSSIKLVRPVLETHRGWAEILSNLIIAAASFGIFFLPVCFFHRLGSDSFFCHPPTSSATKLLELESILPNTLGSPL